MTNVRVPFFYGINMPDCGIDMLISSHMRTTDCWHRAAAKIAQILCNSKLGTLSTELGLVQPVGNEGGADKQIDRYSIGMRRAQNWRGTAKWGLMKALVYTGPQSLEYRDEPDPVSTSDVMVKVAACGVCGSDMHAYPSHDQRRHDERRNAPLILGHEAAGEVLDGPMAGKRCQVTVKKLHDGSMLIG